MLTSPNYIRLLLEKYGFKFKKSLGQNFLTDKNVLERIAGAAEITAQDTVIEIGPGIGALTRVLAQRAGRVICVEIDKKLIPLLEETLADYDNITVINEDALKLDFNELAGPGVSYKIVANLPYYITTPILMHLLEKDFRISTIVVMVQKEVAQRMVARPGGKDYGALSVAIQYHTRAETVLKVPPEVFIPRPTVESAVVKMEVLAEPPVPVKDKKVFFRIVRAAFAQRRKTLYNALRNAALLDKDQLLRVLAECGIDPQRRGETLNIAEFACLSNSLVDIINGSG